MRVSRSVAGLVVGCLATLLSVATSAAAAPSHGGLPEPATASQAPSAPARWWRGQVHIHTNWTAVDDAVSWYRYHQYNFVSITDLNEVTSVSGIKSLFDAPGKFLVIPGVELSVASGGKFFDTLGLGGDSNRMLDAWRKQSTRHAVGSLNRQARSINEAGGLAVAAHPNFAWSWNDKHLLKTDPATVRHFELRNAEHGMNDLGGGGRPSTEEMWDNVLSTGRPLYALATDDSHHFDDFGTDDFFAGGIPYVQAKALPGRTSIFVRARELTPEAILSAISSGDMYAAYHPTNLPIEFDSYTADQNGIRLKLPAVANDKGNTQPGVNLTRYRTHFIGRGGRVLKVDESRRPSYRFTGTERYVRVRVQDSDGGLAWTQPVFVGSGR